MAVDIPKLVAACDRDLMRSLVAQLMPDQAPNIDWRKEGRALGRAIQSAVNGVPKAIVKFQQIEGLARHGTNSTIRSVLYNDRKLRKEFDEADFSRESAVVWLALQAGDLFEEGLSALHVDQGLNKRSWRAFRFRLSQDARLTFDKPQQKLFERLVREAIRNCGTFDQPGELDTHRFQRVLFPEQTHSRRLLEQVTVYAEARIVTEDVIVDAKVQTRVRKKVDSISVIFDRERGELDVVTIGGRDFISDVAQAFFEAFATEQPLLEPLIRRQINFKPLLRVFRPACDETPFTLAKIDEIRVRSPSGALYTFDAKEHRNSEKDVYDVAEQDFGDRNPFERSEWTVVSARLVLHSPPAKPGSKPRMRTIELKSNGHTNLREQDDNDLYIANELLTKWGLLEPSVDDGDDVDPLEVLFRLLAYSGHGVAARQFASSEQLGPFIAAGWVAQGGIPEVVRCISCDDAHPVDVVELDGALNGICSRTGEKFLVSQAAQVHRVDGQAFARSLAEALDLSGAVRRVAGFEDGRAAPARAGGLQSIPTCCHRWRSRW